MEKITRITGSVEGHRFDALLQAEVIRDGGTIEFVELWKCQHAHLTYNDARECADGKLRELTYKII